MKGNILGYKQNKIIHSWESFEASQVEFSLKSVDLKNVKKFQEKGNI